MAFWFFVLGAPLLALGGFMAAAPGKAAEALAAFPRCRPLGAVLCAVAWFWTAHACDTMGIEAFDKFLKAFPGELWILAGVLTFLTCAWMENLLPVRAASAMLMLFPGVMFPEIRLCETQWRLALVVFAYACAVAGMVAMFHPWRARQAIGWICAAKGRTAAAGGALAGTGALFAALGACAAAGAIR